MTIYIANHKAKMAHILVSEKPLKVACNANISAKKHYYVSRSEIRDLQSSKEEYQRNKPKFSLCSFCERKEAAWKSC